MRMPFTPNGTAGSPASRGSLNHADGAPPPGGMRWIVAAKESVTYALPAAPKAMHEPALIPAKGLVMVIGWTASSAPLRMSYASTYADPRAGRHLTPDRKSTR